MVGPTISDNSRRVFPSAGLKHDWANHHIQALHQQWRAFLESDFCEVATEDDATGGQTLRIYSVKKMPATIPLMLGDAIHALNSALDHMITDLVDVNDHRSNFPRDETREQLVAAFRTEPETIAGRTKKKGRYAAIEEAVPGIAQFIIDDIQPYRGADNFLWALNKLDVRDKHRMLILITGLSHISGINAVNENGEPCIRDFSAVLKTDGSIGPIGFTRQKIEITSYNKPSAEIFINEPGVMTQQRVMPTLVYASQTVSETIDRVAQFVLSKKR